MSSFFTIFFLLLLTIKEFISLLFICLFISVSTNILFIFVFVYLSVYQFMCLSVYLILYVCLILSAYLICLLIYLLIYLYICLPIGLSINVFVWLLIYLSIFVQLSSTTFLFLSYLLSFIHLSLSLPSILLISLPMHKCLRKSSTECLDDKDSFIDTQKPLVSLCRPLS